MLGYRRHFYGVIVIFSADFSSSWRWIARRFSELIIKICMADRIDLKRLKSPVSINFNSRFFFPSGIRFIFIIYLDSKSVVAGALIGFFRVFKSRFKFRTIFRYWNYRFHFAISFSDIHAIFWNSDHLTISPLPGLFQIYLLHFFFPYRLLQKKNSLSIESALDVYQQLPSAFM